MKTVGLLIAVVLGTACGEECDYDLEVMDPHLAREDDEPEAEEDDQKDTGVTKPAKRWTTRYDPTTPCTPLSCPQ